MFRLALLLGLAGVFSALTGCGTTVSAFNGPQDTGGEVVAEGTIFFVKYDYGDGKVGGFTRYDTSAAVPGGNGSWNVDARGKLTSKFLVITYNNRAGLREHVIPIDRLYEVQFGDGDLVRIKSGADDHHAATHDHDDHPH